MKLNVFDSKINYKRFMRDLPGMLKELKAMTHGEIPSYIKKKMDVNKLNTVVRSVGIDQQYKRPFSPLIKQMDPGSVVSMSSPLTSAEREYIKTIAKDIYTTYGQPSFTFDTKDGSKNVKVKMGQSLALISPKVTFGASKRRYENFAKYFKPHTFMPDMDILYEAIKVVLEICNINPIAVDFSPAYVKGLFAAHSSNVGYPYYANETNESTGRAYREVTVEDTKHLNSICGSASGMPAIPALIIGRDQPGGLELDLTKKGSLDELITAIDTVQYKPSKARVVYAISRIVNNNINPLVKALITDAQFQNNPFFTGFRSREARLTLYEKYSQIMNEEKLIPVNIDFSSFDTTISAELQVIAYNILFSWLDLSNAPRDLQKAIMASSIYTKAVIFNPKTQLLETSIKEGSIPSGIGTTGIIGLICASIVGTYALIQYYGIDYVKRLIKKAQEKGTFPGVGLGDDLLAAIKDFKDLKALAKIIQDTFGMEISVDGIKTSVGVDFLQEFYTGDSKVSYPIGRVARSALYTERPKGLGACEGVMSWNNMLDNLRTNPQADYDSMCKLIMHGDETKLGFVNPLSGSPISLSQFMKQLKSELDAEGLTAKQALGDGDPTKETRFNDDGSFKSEYLFKVWERNKPIYNKFFANRE